MQNFGFGTDTLTALGIQKQLIKVKVKNGFFNRLNFAIANISVLVEFKAFCYAGKYWLSKNSRVKPLPCPQ